MVVNLHRDRYHHSIPLLEKRSLGTITNMMSWLSTLVTSTLLLVQAVIGRVISPIADQTGGVPLFLLLFIFLPISGVLSVVMAFHRLLVRDRWWSPLSWLMVTMCGLDGLSLIFVRLWSELDRCRRQNLIEIRLFRCIERSRLALLLYSFLNIFFFSCEL